MPFAGFKDFEACVLHMKTKEGYSEEVATKVCGDLKHKHESEHPESKEHSKTMMSAEMALFQKDVTFTDCPKTGDTIFHNVVLMSEGTWTDSLNKKPLKYTASEVANMRLYSFKFKAQHDIYGELPSTNDIGVIENMKLSLNPAQWTGDVRIFPTSLGKDIATLIKRKQITDNSPEFFFDDIERGENGDEMPRGIIFMGAATVRKGACRVCTFNEGTGDNPNLNNIGQNSMVEEQKKPAVSPGGTVAELKSGKESDISKLEAQLADARKLKGQEVEVLGAQLEQVKKARENQASAEIESLKLKVAELESQNKELIQKIVEDDHNIRVKNLERQIAELANQPIIHTTMSATLSRKKADVVLDTGDFPAMSIQDFGE